VQKEIHALYVHLGIWEEQDQMSEVQEHQSTTTDHGLPGCDLQEELITMRCPHCSEDLPGKVCPECDVVVPLDSRYCMMCGVELEEEQTDRVGQDDDLDIENRVLCPDGTCTGIIVDGRCTECGTSAENKSTP
jgi:hypothetical protein